MYVDKISEDFVRKYKDKTPPWGPVGFVVYKRTYSRKVGKQTEEWWETVGRACNGLLAIGGKFKKREIETLYDKVFNLKCCFSGRALWQFGTETVSKLGGDSMMNCWGVTCDDPVHAFCFAFDELMLGGGVGFNIQRESVYEMPKVKYDVKVVRKDEKDVDFIVPDNREGWVELLRRTIEAFYYTGKSFSYSTICVRGKGAPIRSFGGIASGPEDLCEGIKNICALLRNRVGKKLRPLDCLDIMNVIGSVVVAGNVRRSAMLALGDMDDRQFLDAKNWAKGNVPNWRAMSNNSIVCNEIEHLPEKFWAGYNGKGEPYGLINLKNCHAYGRMADGKNYRPDKQVTIVNPCAEISLQGGVSGKMGGESCNLAEIFLPNIKDEAEFGQIAELMLKVTKTISCMSFIYDGTNEIAHKNHRLGVGVTGFLQASHLRDEKIFERVYRRMEEADKAYSKIMGVKPSIKLTCCKPSGTLSLLAGCTSGVHPAYAPFYIRRIRMASDDPLVDICRQHGYYVEPTIRFDGSYDRSTMVVSFPIRSPRGAIVASDISAVRQMEYAAWLQRNWADNSVSVTVYYRREELPDIKDWLSKNYGKSIKTMSFLMHSGHGFKQAPLEEIDEAKYNEMVADTSPIQRINDDRERDLSEGLECTTGMCPVK